MVGQSYEERSFWESMQQGREVPTSTAKHYKPTGPLGNKIQQLLGDDTQPDPLFFEESWTLGLAEAVKNQRRRRQQQAERRHIYRAVDILETLSFMQQKEWQAEQAAAAAQPIATEEAVVDQPQQAVEDAFEQVEAQEAEEWKRFAEARASLPSANSPMTMPIACQMLGVPAGSSREQVKTAYRRMVSQWHPDRLQHKSEEVRQLATEQMAAINEAYHLLREGQHQQAA